MKKLVIGNWKLNPASLEEAKEIIHKAKATAAQLSHTEVVLCPPFVFISAITDKDAESVTRGAQSVSVQESGSHTGEVSAAMLKGMGVKYVLAGHSEERARGDSDEIVAGRVKAILENGMHAVLCVGEKERDENGEYLEALKIQIQKSLALVPAGKAKNIVMAYEPIWAIGAQEAMKAEQVYEMSIFVKKVFSDVFTQEQAMKVTILYGGSVNFSNAADIISVGKVDGLLVGRESINLTGFSDLLKVVDEIK
ncbi:MAG: triose-phosphate isomerase [bacterium]|nr:triose-phosphate isomerase [bacterium]